MLYDKTQLTCNSVVDDLTDYSLESFLISNVFNEAACHVICSYPAHSVVPICSRSMMCIQSMMLVMMCAIDPDYQISACSSVNTSGSHASA